MIELLEAAMLTSFSLGWYFSIFKMLKARRACGKSLFFVVLVASGYAMGAASKWLFYLEGGVLPHIFYLYIWNFLVVVCDGWLVIVLGRKTASGSAPRQRTGRVSPSREATQPPAPPQVKFP